MIIIHTKLSNLKTAYVTYQLRNHNGLVQYVGTCRLSRIMQLPDAIRHPDFATMFDTSKPISIEGIFISNSRTDCHAKRIELIKSLNLKPVGGELKGQHNVPITCVETGEVFHTLQDVVKAHGCTLAALCNHLQHKPMYNTVKGKTYYRGLPLADSQLQGDK